ncbi:fucose isomerase [Rhodobacterales bacterium HKCCE2091]|nr:fucose isomerase [Rhodobacterales bacterium HKCCE2091]
MTEIHLFASGDLRESANRTCWPAQAAMEEALGSAVAALGHTLRRAHPVDPATGHGFLSSQRMGMEAFRDIDPEAPVIVAEAVWQYSHHVLPGLIHHRGPVLTVANWSGQWPGLVGMLNLNGSLAKANVPFSTLWSEDFTDGFFRDRLAEWLETGTVTHDLSHVAPCPAIPDDLAATARDIAAGMRRDKLIMGVFDEGCMGMFNAIIPDHLLHPTGVFKERLSQSTLYAETLTVPEAEGEKILSWLEDAGMGFRFGSDPDTELTREQVVMQGRMYVAACRLAERFGCDAIGIQYQQGLKDLLPASDLVEGLLNNDDRPPAPDEDGQPIRPGRAITHFNEVDECAGLDALLIDRVHRALGQPAENTLHDLRWGDEDRAGDAGYVWVFEISGAAPAAHHGGYANCEGHRQPPMYFRLGGSTLSGVAKPGPIVWSRIYVEDDRLKMDIGLGEALELSPEETTRRREATTKEWPIMHARLHGVSRDQMMARHKANHVQVAYATDAEAARRALLCRAALAQELGIEVAACGTV